MAVRSSKGSAPPLPLPFKVSRRPVACMPLGRLEVAMGHPGPARPSHQKDSTGRITMRRPIHVICQSAAWPVSKHPRVVVNMVFQLVFDSSVPATTFCAGLYELVVMSWKQRIRKLHDPELRMPVSNKGLPCSSIRKCEALI